MKEFTVYVFSDQASLKAAKDMLFGTFCEEQLVAVTSPTVNPPYHPGHTRKFSVAGKNNNEVVHKIKEIGLENFEKGAT